MSRDLRQDFDNILRKWGHNIILQRVLNPYESNEEAKYFNENGQRKLEIHTVRHTYPGSRALGSVAQEEIEGILHTYEFIYYFRHNVDPIAGDRVLENLSTDTLFTDGLFTHPERYPGLNMFTVDMAIPLRGKGGRIVYWIAGVTRDNDLMKIKD